MIPSSCSTFFESKPTTNDFGRVLCLTASFLHESLPSMVFVHPPPAPQRPQEGPQEHPVPLRPQAAAGDTLSAPSSTFSPPLSPSPPLAHPSEHLFFLGPKFEPLWCGRAPWPHVLRHLTAGRLDLPASRCAVEGIGFPYFSWTWAERSYGPAIPCRGDPMQQCTFSFIF
jgi:hypothetical protein